MARAVRREELGLALLLLLLLLLASYLPSPAEATPLEELGGWMKGAKRTLKAYWWDGNPYVRCVKKGWPHCLKSYWGLNGWTTFFCPIAIYWECAWAWRVGRRPFDAPDPNLPGDGWT